MKEIKTLYFQNDYPENPNNCDLWIQPKPYKIIDQIDLKGRISQEIEYGWNILYMFSAKKECWITVFDFPFMTEFLHMLKNTDYYSFCHFEYKQANDNQIEKINLRYKEDEQ